MRTYFHSSVRDYETGKRISIDSFKGNFNLDHIKRTKHEQSINLEMDQIRPAGFPSRTKTLYLFDDLNLCRFYATGLGLSHIKLYEGYHFVGKISRL
jgi:hypothetical protein